MFKGLGFGFRYPTCHWRYQYASSFKQLREISGGRLPGGYLKVCISVTQPGMRVSMHQFDHFLRGDPTALRWTTPLIRCVRNFLVPLQE